ncbi:MAG: cadherin repeat domain-containing protein [Verrucomicrobiae bacterium]|nr:cadherin repeat domain-containing protein [Verrucomicrobiae bacterium]
MACLLRGPAVHAAPTVVWHEDFESDQVWEDWFVEGGVWQAGVPTSGPGRAKEGTRCAATNLGGNYSDNVNSRLITHSFLVPEASENPRLRFWHWFEFHVELQRNAAEQPVEGGDYGRLQIREVGGAWQNLGGEIRGSSSGAWSPVSVGLAAFAGRRVQIGFHLHTRWNSARALTEAPGWYLDEVSLVRGPIEFGEGVEGFENGVGDWSAEYGSWEVGPLPASFGPRRAFRGANVMGTRLAANYQDNAQSRLMTPEFTVPDADENPRLRFWHWFEFHVELQRNAAEQPIEGGDYGRLQIREVGGAWQNLGGEIRGNSSGAWSPVSVALGGFAGKRVQVGFNFQAHWNSGRSLTTAPGWYLDEVSLVRGPIAFRNPEGFEEGPGDWSAEFGSWEIGVVPLGFGPRGAYRGRSVMGTRVAADYWDNTASHLISPTFLVPPGSLEPRLSFWHFHGFYVELQRNAAEQPVEGGDYGKVQIREVGGAWRDLSGEIRGSSGEGWSPAGYPLTSYAGRTVQIGFYLHTRWNSGRTHNTAPGWYIDEVSIRSGYLDRIANQVVDEGALMTVPLSLAAPVPEVRLGSDAPDGMQVDLGVVTWIPGEEHGPGTYTVTVEAVDPNNTLTPLDFRTFEVRVNEVNQPPQIDPIPRQTIAAGVPLVFTVTAFDLDRPVLQAFTFGLGDGAPAGASIQPQTGLFSWTPTEEQAGREHTITVRVTDNGQPPMSGMASFVAGPGEGWRIGDFSLRVGKAPGGGLEFCLAGGATAGKYAIEWAPAFHAQPNLTQWTRIGELSVAAGALGCMTLAADEGPSRFYRAVQIP